METANRTFVETTGMEVAEFVKQCNAEGIEPIAETERVIRALAAEGEWGMDAEELDEQIENVTREVREAMSEKHVIGANNRRFTMNKGLTTTTIRFSCYYAGAHRDLPILISNDGVNFKMANGGSDQYNNFIASVIEHNDFLVIFPNIKIEDD